MKHLLLTGVATLALIVSAHAQTLQEQILDGRLTVRVPESMVEMGVRPDDGPDGFEETKRLWVYQKGEVMFSVAETRYKACVKTSVILSAVSLMKAMVPSSVDRLDVEDKGTYQMASFIGLYQEPSDYGEAGTVTVLVIGQTEWVLLSVCKKADRWKLAHSLPLQISFK